MVSAAGEICGDASEEDRPAGRDDLDLKPEYCQYRDEGCKYARSCLECPFPQCFYEKRGGEKRRLKETRNKEIRKLFRSGRKVKELAELFKVSRRTVRRVLKEKKRGTGDE